MASVTLWLNVKAGGTVRSLPCLFQNGKMSRIVLMYFTAEDMLKQSTSQRRAAAIAITQLSDMCLTALSTDQPGDDRHWSKGIEALRVVARREQAAANVLHAAGAFIEFMIDQDVVAPPSGTAEPLLPHSPLWRSRKATKRRRTYDSHALVTASRPKTGRRS